MSTQAPMTGSTKDLKRTLGKSDLMGIAVGQIIGAGIMSMVGVGIGMTGRSANVAIMLSAVFTIFKMIPIIFVASVVRMRGGVYTQMGLFAGDWFAGAYSVIFVVTNMSLAMYALSFADYFIALVPGIPQKLVAVVVASVFCILNIFGVDMMAKIQNLLVIVLVLALALFAFYGIPQVDLANYFSNADGLFMVDGMAGVMTTASYLAFATGGAQVILNVSAECKNPQKDIPFVIILSTFSVAFLYGLVTTAAAGVLPVTEVMNKPLTLVANVIFPPAIYVFFIVGGAMFALATTLNSQLMSCTKPIMQACEDGWFPKSFGSLSKWKTPWKLLIFFYGVAVLPIAIGLDISQISSIVLIVGYVVTLITTILTYKVPKLFPEQWAKSTFRVSTPVLNILLLCSSITTLIQFYFVSNKVNIQLMAFNIGIVAFSFGYAWLRRKSGHINVTVSYDLD